MSRPSIGKIRNSVFGANVVQESPEDLVSKPVSFGGFDMGAFGGLSDSAGASVLGDGIKDASGAK